MTNPMQPSGANSGLNINEAQAQPQPTKPDLDTAIRNLANQLHVPDQRQVSYNYTEFRQHQHEIVKDLVNEILKAAGVKVS